MADYVSYYVFTCACHSKDKILDRMWSSVSIGEVPFVGLIEYDFPEYASLHAIQVNEGSYPHLKALLYHDLNDTNEEILPGEIMIAPRLIIEQYEMIPLSLTYDCAGNSLRLQIFQS
ncbi:hypothetical protein ASPCADRAFT_9008 [Aspergillus carbonarius ITEM 5010]|uniref:Uncharacterized protein n=1 Tax=Aspergillus carbonarius (strain ITEM 5010) TaxID=602072 RepID=A0A1R3RCE0_ASPC5|nr:hypothetical protein ASPCADRAFT_9008 [Aspergillus carbonarius ITEM 5010]